MVYLAHGDLSENHILELDLGQIRSVHVSCDSKGCRMRGAQCAHSVAESDL
jgi:hypothetical protein